MSNIVLRQNLSQPLTIAQADQNLTNLNNDKMESNTSSSVDGEMALFSGTTGKLLKRATATGVPKLASGVVSLATAADIVSLIGTTPVSNATIAANGGVTSISVNGGASQTGPVSITIPAQTVEIPSGTAMLFAQAAQPVGWTKSTTHDDKVLRVVSNSGGGSGGSVAFSTLFGRTAVDGSSLSIAQLAAHTHNMTGDNERGDSSSSSYTGGHNSNNGYFPGSVKTTSSAGSGSTHTHGIDLRVQYVDVIICTKN